MRAASAGVSRTFKFCSFVIDNNDAFALIPARYQTVATIFKKAGYAMAAIGKWHLGLGDRGGIDWNKPIPHTPNDIWL
ncbi:hypothetical protein CGC59_07015 [Capnocytophaga sputigena]|uniref:Uncharacterized protein n=1 Tax=Capnocytophaga sputigena TaxID=1019 RepID=A0A250F626_CAPSP|nr:sulfatase-like hydrolase/transferase [Capnocytophaga sputigena]ATA79437.1 hypothetical protein CGC59_07015 [Capnocytophaga sputigena]